MRRTKEEQDEFDKCIAIFKTYNDAPSEESRQAVINYAIWYSEKEKGETRLISCCGIAAVYPYKKKEWVICDRKDWRQVLLS